MAADRAVPAAAEAGRPAMDTDWQDDLEEWLMRYVAELERKA